MHCVLFLNKQNKIEAFEVISINKSMYIKEFFIKFAGKLVGPQHKLYFCLVYLGAG